jgi:hypothetical protein
MDILNHARSFRLKIKGRRKHSFNRHSFLYDKVTTGTARWQQVRLFQTCSFNWLIYDDEETAEVM